MLGRLKVTLLVKFLTTIFVLSVILLVAIWLILPSYLKGYVEENDQEWIQRDITIQKVNINPFTFTVSTNNVEIKEPNSSKNFVTFDKLLVNFDFWPLLQSKISIKEITLTNLLGSVVQKENSFNFSDLLTSKKTNETETPSEPIEFNLRNINIIKSSIHYTDTQLGSTLVLDSITIKDQSFTSVDTIFDADVTFQQPEGGKVKGAFEYDLSSDNYKVDTVIETWQLAPFKSYVTSGIRLSEFDGELGANINIAGNTNTDFIKSSGQVSVDDFKLVDPENKPLISIGKFFMDITQIDSQTNVYDFKNILVDNSHINFEYLPNGDNFTKWLVTSNTSPNNASAEENTTTDYYVSPFEMLSVYIYDMTKEYIFKSYTAEKILFSNFNLKFYDYTLEDPFFMDLTGVTIGSDNIRPENQFANFHVNGKMNSTGIIDGDISVSRQGVENMTVDMNVKGLFLNRFSPYGRFYTAHRFMEGISSFSNKSVIKDSYLTSTNRLHVEKIKVSKKDKTKSGNSLPMRLAVALIKDANGNVNLDIPIEGPINDPKYKYGKVIWQVVKNLFAKMIASPAKALSNALKINENDLKNIYFDNGQIGLSPFQKKPLDAIVGVLNKKPALTIALTHLYNKEYEMDAIALKSAKIAYLKQSDVELDKSIPIGKQAFDLSSTDPEFLAYLKTKTPGFDETISIPENARRLLSREAVVTQLESVIEKQKQLIKEYLVVEKAIPENRFSIKDGAFSEEAMNQSRPKFEVKFEAVE